MAGPLAGYRIVDVTRMLSGPMATMILGDQGADVIKVETPDGGDLTRALGGASRGMAPLFATTNRNKRSIALDLKQPVGIEVLETLVADADLFVQNFRPGTAERLGIGEEALRRIKPELVYVSINGFGDTGPYAHKRVYDPIVQAVSGLAAIQADAEGRPRMLRLIVPDKVTALTAAQAMTAALLARERTGTGQHVRLSMLDAVIAFLWPEGMARLTLIGPDIGPGRPPAARDLIFETTDGYITVGAVSDGEWRALCGALERPQWITDERFRTPAHRVKNADVRLELTAEILRTRSSRQWLEGLDRVGVPCAPVLTREQVIEDAQVLANELIVESEHPQAGRMREPRPAARFEATPAELARPAPTLGQHSDEILTEAGFDAAAIERMRADSVIS